MSQVKFSDKNENNSTSSDVKDDFYFSENGKIETREIFGNCVVASRLIEPGEIILEDFPLNVSPNGPKNGLSCCIVCYKDLDQGQKCSTCKWPVCSTEICQKSIHHLRECEIFSSRKVLPASIKIKYKALRVLRCLLMSERNKKGWEKILTFEDHVEIRRQKAKTQESTKILIHFIRTQCGLEKFSPQLIERVYGISTTNEYWTYFHTQKYASVMFEKGSMFNHSCLPNAKYAILYNEDYPNYFKLQISALRQIQKGEIVFIDYVYEHYKCDLTGDKNIESKQDWFKRRYHFECSCQLCAQ